MGRIRTLDVKPAIKDADANSFLVFLFALLKAKLNPTSTRMGIEKGLTQEMTTRPLPVSQTSHSVSSRVGESCQRKVVMPIA